MEMSEYYKFDCVPLFHLKLMLQCNYRHECNYRGMIVANVTTGTNVPVPALCSYLFQVLKIK